MDHRHSGLRIGVDGGGSGCRAAIADACGVVLGQGRSGPANATTDITRAITHMLEAIAAAAADAGVSRDALRKARACIGLAGVKDSQTASRITNACDFAAVQVIEDRETALAGALGARDGVLIALGTGTIIAGRKDGRIIHLNGWGLAVGDQASGAWLGRGLLERVMLCHDGLMEWSALTRAASERFGGTPERIAMRAACADPAAFADLAPMIGTSDDVHAVALMQAGAAYLTQALAFLAPRAGDIVCLTGGVGPSYAPCLPNDVQALLAPPQGTALEGALALAARLAPA